MSCHQHRGLTRLHPCVVLLGISSGLHDGDVFPNAEALVLRERSAHDGHHASV